MPSRQYGHRLRARRARKTVAEEIREPLAETADGSPRRRTSRGGIGLLVNAVREDAS